MRNPERIEPFLMEVAQIWKKNFPDWRFGQLFCNLQRATRCDMFFFEEDEMVKVLKMFAAGEDPEKIWDEKINQA